MRKQKRNQKPIIDLHDAKQELTHTKSRKSEIKLIPRNTVQEEYIDYLNDRNTRITFAIGPAGTGKTYLSVLKAIKSLQSGEIQKIVVTRPAVSVDEKHGFLPGDLNAKMEPWTKPIFDVFDEYYNPKQVQDMLADGVIEIAPLGFMRGRTFKSSYIIADEMQNATPDQMKMLLTRIGEYSYMTVTGDVKQHDRGFEANGLMDFVKRLKVGCKGLAMVEFSRDHVVRDPIVKAILGLYGED